MFVLAAAKWFEVANNQARRQDVEEAGLLSAQSERSLSAEAGAALSAPCFQRLTCLPSSQLKASHYVVKSLSQKALLAYLPFLYPTYSAMLSIPSSSRMTPT